MEEKLPDSKARVAGEFFLHRYLWLGADRILTSEREALEGSDFPRLASLLLMYFAFEAFLNDLGPRICPSEWANERDYFSRGTFRGTLGKLDYLAKTLGLSFDKGTRPYQTVAELDRRRDTLVHPTTEQFDKEVPSEHVTAVSPEVFQVAPEEFVGRVRTDVVQIADTLQAAAYEQYGSGTVLFQRAFEGSLGYQNTWLAPRPETPRS